MCIIGQYPTSRRWCSVGMTTACDCAPNRTPREIIRSRAREFLGSSEDARRCVIDCFVHPRAAGAQRAPVPCPKSRRNDMVRRSRCGRAPEPVRSLVEFGYRRDDTCPERRRQLGRNWAGHKGRVMAARFYQDDTGDRRAASVVLRAFIPPATPDPPSSPAILSDPMRVSSTAACP